MSGPKEGGPSKALRRTAHLWLLRLQRADATEDDRAACEAWRSADPSHAEAFAHATREQAWARSQKALLARAGNLLAQKHAARAKRLRRRAPFVFAAGAAFCLLFGLVWFWPVQSVNYATMIGARQEVLLADGSRIALNTGTKLNVRLGRHVRRVQLERGEAHFEVAQNKGRSFEVEVGAQRLRVLGTAFSVRWDEERFDVLVTEGVLGFTSMAAEDQARTLEAGQRLVLIDGRAQVFPLTEDEAARALAWRHGMLAFAGEPLSYVVGEVARHTGAHFVITDPALERLSVIAYLRAGNLEGFLSLLEDTFPELLVTRNGNVVLISARQPDLGAE